MYVSAYLLFSISVNRTALGHVGMVINTKHYPGNNRGSQYQFLEGVGISDMLIAVCAVKCKLTS